MADEYVSQVELDINGQIIDDFKSVSIKETELFKPVNLMTKTGFMKTQERPAVDVEYVVPENTSEFDFTTVKNGRLSIIYGNGKKTTLLGVYTLKIGELKIDGDNEATKTIELGATRRIEE